MRGHIDFGNVKRFKVYRSSEGQEAEALAESYHLRAAQTQNEHLEYRIVWRLEGEKLRRPAQCFSNKMMRRRANVQSRLRCAPRR